MASNLKTLDSVGGFSVDQTTLVNETKDLVNINSLEVKSSFFADSSTTHYIMRGINTAVLSTDDVSSSIPLLSETINFIEASVIGVNDDASGIISTKLDSVISVSASGVATELSTMTTTVKDSIPSGQTWTIAPFLGGSANTYSYQTTRAGTTRTVKWFAYVKVVSIDWT